MEGIGLSRKIRRLLGRLLVLTSILIILHSPLITKWMYSESNQNDEQVSIHNIVYRYVSSKIRLFSASKLSECILFYNDTLFYFYFLFFLYVKYIKKKNFINTLII